MVINNFVIKGMTCAACVQKVTEVLSSIPSVTSVNVSLENRMTSIESRDGILLKDVIEILKSLPKYSVFHEDQNSVGNSLNLKEESKFKTYKPLILIFTYIFLVAFSYQVYQGSFHFHLFMNHIMAGFFISLSFFKFLDLNAFAESFSSYDPIAQKFLKYGLIYPFIEILLGLMFVSEIGLLEANIATIVVLASTTAGVIKRLRSKSKIQCACAGAGFNLPLSYVTVFENLTMILMALYGLASSIKN